MAQKETEYGLPSGRKEGGVTPYVRRAAAGSWEDLDPAEAIRDIYALDSLVADEEPGEVEVGRQATDKEPRRAPFNH